jgi:two-component system cell cycle response regulator
VQTMTLRRRAAWFVVVVIVLPLLAGALLVQRSAQVAATDAPAQVDAALVDALAAYDTTTARLADQAQILADRNAAEQVTTDRPGPARRWLRRELDDPRAVGRADFAVLVRRDRTPLAAAVTDDAIDIDARVDEIADAVTGEPPPGLLLHSRALWPTGRFVGWVVAGRVIDDGLLRALPADDSALVEDGRVVAATAPVPWDPAALPVEHAATRARIVDGTAVALRAVAPGRTLLAWRPAAGVGPLVLAWVILLGWAVAAVWLAVRVTGRAIAAPILRAATVARHATEGMLDERVDDETGPAELRALGAAVNGVGGELDRRQRELAGSREQLRGALSRLGETLSSSLNLDRTLAVVTDTAMDTVQADRGTLVLTTEDDDLDIRIDRGFDLPPDTRFGGHSLPGWVVRTGLSVRLPADRVVISSAVDDGILATHQLSVPVTGTATGGCIGALLLGRADGHPAFTEEDLRTVRTFASQAGVAIENVLLHQEARRLSLTDPLTELWNFRYFQLQALREVEAATRYGRPLGLLIVDLDHFKRVNDRHGHPVGDQVLAEVGRRIRTSTRLPDIVARYGGEEFVLLLPGTDAAGAVVTAERIRRRVSRLPIVAGGRDALRISVTCSVGVAAYPAHGRSVEELLRRADAALYTAKSAGRDRVVNADDVADDVRVPRTEGGRRIAAG